MFVIVATVSSDYNNMLSIAFYVNHLFTINHMGTNMVITLEKELSRILIIF